jgi:hypothetical protein
MNKILIKTYSGADRYADRVIKDNFELSKDKYGWTITDNNIGVSYAERNYGEKDMFDLLYKKHFTLN